MSEEAKGIYAGLFIVESKCVEVDNAQAAAPVNFTTKFDGRAVAGRVSFPLEAPLRTL